MSGRICQSPDDVPKGPHYAILEFSSITIPGDERSRTHPGHGYPERTETHATYTAYMIEAEWKAETARLAAPGYWTHRNYVAIHVTPATVTTAVTVDVKP